VIGLSDTRSNVVFVIFTHPPTVMYCVRVLFSPKTSFTIEFERVKFEMKLITPENDTFVFEMVIGCCIVVDVIATDRLLNTSVLLEKDGQIGEHVTFGGGQGIYPETEILGTEIFI